MGLTERLDRFQRRHPAAGFPLAVVYKFADDQGTYLAALITYYGFLSVFPLLLVFATVLGIVLRGHPELQQQVLDSTLSELPVIGDQLGDPRRLGGGTAGLVIGILGALYGGLGGAQAVQHAMNTAWAVPRNRRPNPFAARGRSLLLLGTIGLVVLATTVLSTLGSTSVASDNALVRTGLTALSVVVNGAVFVLGFRLGTTRRLTARQVAPGALAAAVVWQLLQSFGGVYVTHVVRTASATNAVFAVVLGLIAFLYVAALALVLCVEVDAVRVDRLHPRALLTPFTDAVELTEGDERVYTDAAQAQTAKGFQTVEVSFDPDPHRDADRGSGADRQPRRAPDP
jgi:inner membrane protein YhjD